MSNSWEIMSKIFWINMQTCSYIYCFTWRFIWLRSEYWLYILTIYIRFLFVKKLFISLLYFSIFILVFQSIYIGKYCFCNARFDIVVISDLSRLDLHMTLAAVKTTIVLLVYLTPILWLVLWFRFHHHFKWNLFRNLFYFSYICL